MLIVCGKCGEEKNPHQFYNAWSKSRKANGKHSWCKKCCQKYAAAKYQSDPQFKARRLEHREAWYRANPERMLYLRDRSHARERGCKRFLSFEEWQELRSSKTCHWCGMELHVSFTNVDHIVPVSQGGEHNRENLVLSCANCNAKRKWLSATRADRQ